MKKAIVLLLAAVMLSSALLVSCGGNGSKKTDSSGDKNSSSKSGASGTTYSADGKSGGRYQDIIDDTNDYILTLDNCFALVDTIEDIESSSVKGVNVVMTIPESVNDALSEENKELAKLLTIYVIRDSIYPYLEDEFESSGRTVVIELVDTLSGKRLTTVIPTKESVPEFNAEEWDYVYEG